jgi:uncharacterized protein
MDNVDSPCTGVCRLGADQFCVGCGRTLDEITEWPTAAAGRRALIRQAASIRLRALGPSESLRNDNPEGSTGPPEP